MGRLVGLVSSTHRQNKKCRTVQNVVKNIIELQNPNQLSEPHGETLNSKGIKAE